MYDTIAQVVVGLVIALAIESRTTRLVQKKRLRRIYLYPVAAALTLLMGVSLWQEAGESLAGRVLAVVVAALVFYVMWLMGVAEHLVKHGRLFRGSDASQSPQLPDQHP
jgi:hypothetical protein